MSTSLIDKADFSMADLAFFVYSRWWSMRADTQMSAKLMMDIMLHHWVAYSTKVSGPFTTTEARTMGVHRAANTSLNF